MPYCTSCGAEVGAGDEFCAECGTEIPAQSMQETEVEQEEGEETAACEKCESQIPPEAIKCPQCGYEPSKQTIGAKIIAIPSFLVFGFSVLMLLIMPLVVVDGGLSLSDATISFGFFGLLAAFSGAILWAYMNQDNRTPTDSSLTNWNIE